MIQKPIYLIAAVDKNLGIGKNGIMPWHLSDELKHFRNITTTVYAAGKQNAVIMGRTTWESLPENYRPLKDRFNIVLTKGPLLSGPNLTTSSLDEAIAECNQSSKIENIFIIGGASIYEQAINHPAVSGIYLTEIEGSFDCDKFFPSIPSKFDLTEILGEKKEGDTHYRYLLLKPSI